MTSSRSKESSQGLDERFSIKVAPMVSLVGRARATVAKARKRRGELCMFE